MTAPPARIDIKCPLCGTAYTVQFTCVPRLTHTHANGEGFLTAQVGVGGVTHRCLRIKEKK